MMNMIDIYRLQNKQVFISNLSQISTKAATCDDSGNTNSWEMLDSD